MGKGRSVLSVALMVAALAGCALKKPPERVEITKQSLPNVQVPPAFTAAGGAASTAGTVVEQAASYAKVAGATLLPQVNALARGGGALSGDSSGLEGVGVFANWELDLWGRVRAGREATRDQYTSAALDAEYAR